ncbi:MAG: DNA-binding response regulator [Melioribacteraceae bacterium]|nr:MAG: DNA-binding response regulator [Melioribacteraceae bacterium]
MQKINILLIEDNRLLRDGIKDVLSAQPDMNVVATISNGENIINLLSEHNLNVVLLDLGLRNRSSLNLVKTIKKNCPEIKIIIMDLIPIDTQIYEFVQAGVSGFILKDAEISDFYSTIRSVNNGEQVLPPDLTGTLFAQIIEQAIQKLDSSTIKEAVRMTRREKEVVELISEGFTNKEIAQKMHLSPYTVKSHVHNILEKLALSSRVQIAIHAHDNQSDTSGNN